MSSYRTHIHFLQNDFVANSGFTVQWNIRLKIEIEMNKIIKKLLLQVSISVSLCTRLYLEPKPDSSKLEWLFHIFFGVWVPDSSPDSSFAHSSIIGGDRTFMREGTPSHMLVSSKFIYFNLARSNWTWNHFFKYQLVHQFQDDATEQWELWNGRFTKVHQDYNTNDVDVLP